MRHRNFTKDKKVFNALISLKNMQIKRIQIAQPSTKYEQQKYWYPYSNQNKATIFPFNLVFICMLPMEIRIHGAENKTTESSIICYDGGEAVLESWSA